MRDLKKILLVVPCVLWMFSSASAQVASSAIVGIVLDQSGAVIPGVKVTVAAPATRFQRTVTTGEDGGYVMENLQPGEYQILASETGFKEKTITGLVLQVGQRARIDVKMEIGPMNQSVVVQGAAPLVETQNGMVGNVITSNFIEEMPLDGRNFLQLALLTPGVIKTFNPPFMETTGGSVSANGLSNAANNTMIDGVMNQETGAGRMTFSPDIDMIQEFDIVTNAYDAQYGRTGGAQIEVATKRGIDAYHGSGFEFLRNDNVDARPFFQPTALPHFVRNQFGGSFGGPIPRFKKNFFFFSFEGLRSVEGLTAVLSLPPNNIRNGDFTGTGATIYDPNTYDPTTHLRQPFLGDVIPASRISPITTFFSKKYFPSVTSTLPFNNYVANPVQTGDSNQLMFRFDRNFSDRDSLMVRYTRNKFVGLLPRSDSGQATPLPGLGELNNLYGENHEIAWTHLFNPTFMNSLKLGFSQYFQDRFSQTYNKGLIAQSGLQGIVQVEAGIPAFSFQGNYTGLTDNFLSPVIQPFNNYIVEDTFTKVIGKHSIKMGGSLLYNRTQTDLNAGFTRGVLSFSPEYTTQGPGKPGNQFNAWAEFLLGIPGFTIITDKSMVTDWRAHLAAGFIQDDWRFSKNLTLNLGMRYEVYTKPFDTKNRMSAFDIQNNVQVYPEVVPTADPAHQLPGPPAGSVVAETLGYPRDLQFPTTWNDWGPRFGFAYRLFGSDKTALRGGFGQFYDWLVIDSATSLSLGPPWVTQTSQFCGNAVPCLTMPDPFVNPSGLTGKTSITPNKTNRTPYLQSWSLGIQRQLGRAMSLDVSYVGNLGRKEYQVFNINQANPGPGDPQARRPYPRYGDQTAFLTGGNSHYDSLQVALRKTIASKGLTYLANFSWGNALGDATNGPQISENQPFRDARNLKAEYGKIAYNRGKVFTTSWIYELPVGKGKSLLGNLHGVPNAVLGGWKLDGIAILQSGDWFNAGETIGIAGAGTTRPDMICNPNNWSRPSRGAAIQQWFNVNCFQHTHPFSFGNEGVGVIEGPGYDDLDLAVHKDFLISENKRIQLRVESFNALNHTNLADPANLSFGALGFGSINSIQGNAREFQFGARFDF